MQAAFDALRRMYDAADEMLGAIGQARKAVSSVEKKTVYSKVKGSVKGAIASALRRVASGNPFKRNKKKGEAAEEKVEAEVVMSEETNEVDVSAAKEKWWMWSTFRTWSSSVQPCSSGKLTSAPCAQSHLMIVSAVDASVT